MARKKVEDVRRQAQRLSQRFAEGAHNELMKLQERQASRDKSFTQTALGFLNTEVDTGLVLAGIAKSVTDEDAKARNCRHAREAYDTIIKYGHTAAHASSEALDALHKK